MSSNMKKIASTCLVVGAFALGLVVLQVPIIDQRVETVHRLDDHALEQAVKAYGASDDASGDVPVEGPAMLDGTSPTRCGAPLGAFCMSIVPANGEGAGAC